ncbi:hypothetical protein GTU73_01585 [Rathayibacter sp. VKM Ac-2804]|uniref:hypothetical protein n=1 Tax=Rathayibacter sp. VKM Ac-2804 TaxID=2609257 RepID=UPI00132E7596|nr:hypothetical protein [Rathayibacter sp. VKM Ac-2804]QHF22823.1 hypothetical protein GTU73_01585 [Rathayibacter sp. VKM Ac-2804]
MIEGYPDLAFADQNGNTVDVDFVRGGSFMTEDAGPVRVEIPAGAEVAVTGWALRPIGENTTP